MKVIKIMICALLIGFSFLGNSVRVAAQEAKMETSVRTNLRYIEGNPDDTYVVYTYDENGKHYKVVDDANSDYTEVKSQTYILNADGKYSLIENSSLVKDEKNDNMEFSVKKVNGNSYTEKLPLETNLTQNDSASSFDGIMSVTSSSKPALSGWHKSTYSGSTKFRDMAITAIKAAIIQYTISRMQSNKAKVAASSVTAVAQKYFKLKLKTGYYHTTYKWKTLKNNILVIMTESEYVKWYKDASHTKYNGATSSYWSEY